MEKRKQDQQAEQEIHEIAAILGLNSNVEELDPQILEDQKQEMMRYEAAKKVQRKK